MKIKLYPFQVNCSVKIKGNVVSNYTENIIRYFVNNYIILIWKKTNIIKIITSRIINL